MEYLSPIGLARSYYKKGNFIYYAGCVRDSNNAQIGVLIKFNLVGDTLWQKFYRDPQQDVIPHMVTASVDGGFLVTGFFQDWINIVSPGLIIKTDANGNELWRKEINKVVPNVCVGRAIVQDSATKKIIIVGYQYLGSASAFDTYDNVVVLDSLGVKLSQHTLGGDMPGVLYDLIQTSDKKMVAVGAAYVKTPQDNLSYSYVVKFDLNGPLNLPASPLFVNSNFDYLNFRNAFTCIYELPNGDFLIGGDYDTLQNQNIMPNWMTRLVRMDKNGNVIWKKYYTYWHTPGVSNEQSMMSMCPTSDNGIVASLYSFNTPAPAPAIFIKWDSTGCDSSQAYCQMVAAGISRNYLQDEEVKVFPNPTQGLLQISVSATALVVYDITGREIKRVLLDANMQDHKIDLRTLDDGVYTISLLRNKVAVYKGKVVKQ